MDGTPLDELLREMFAPLLARGDAAAAEIIRSLDRAPSEHWKDGYRAGLEAGDSRIKWRKDHDEMLRSLRAERDELMAALAALVDRVDAMTTSQQWTMEWAQQTRARTLLSKLKRTEA